MEVLGALVVAVSLVVQASPGLAGEKRASKSRDKSKATDAPTSYVRRIPPPNLDKDLVNLVPLFANDISKMMSAVCKTGGRVAEKTFEDTVHAAGLSTSEPRFFRKEFGSDVLAEAFASRLDLQRGFIKVTSKFISGVWSSSLLEITERDPFIPFVWSRKEIAKVSMDEDCVAEDLILFNYDSLGYLSRVDFLEAGFSAYRPVYEPLKSMEEIYTPEALRSLGELKPPTLEEIKQRQSREGRVLVAIYDSGIDYNHPKLAYKIPAPKFARTRIVDARLDIIRAKLLDLRVQIANAAATPRGGGTIEFLRQQAEALRQEAQQYVTGWAFDRDDHLPFDFSYEPNNPFRQFSHHGTHVAGIVSLGTDLISILPVRYPLRERDHFTAIKYAFDSGARLLNMSLSSRIEETFNNLSRALDTFSEMLFVVAAGNDGASLDQLKVWPTEYQRPNLISVASIDENGVFDSGSNWSSTKVDLAALGVRVQSLAPMALGGVATYTGTSQAAPQVTRVAALLKARHPRLTVSQIRNHLCATATKSDPDIMRRVRCGVLNAAKALSEYPRQ